MSTEAAAPEKPGQGEINGKAKHEPSVRKERPQKRGGGRFEPYGNPSKRYRVFVSNIPYDVKWQALKDLMKEKDMESIKANKTSHNRSFAVVEFRTEELMKKAVEKVNKHNLNGRPLKVKEDPDGVIAQRDAGKIGSTVFVANLDYKVGWKKLKEVFGMAGVVVRTDILEDKDGNSRGMGTVTFDMPIEAVQAVSMFNGQLLFNRVMHVKLDEKSLPKGDFAPPERPPALPRGLSGIGLGLGPGGQPIDATALNRGGGGMGNMGPGGMDNFGGMNNMERFGPSGMGRMNEMDRGLGGSFDREFGRNDMGMSRNNFGESFERGMGSSLGMDRMSSGMDRLGGGMDRLGGMERMGMERMDRVSDLDRLGGSAFDRMGSGLDRLGPSMDRLGSGLDRMSSSVDRLGPAGFDRLGPSSLERMPAGLDFASPMGMADRMERMGTNFDRMGSAGIDRFPATGLDRMGSTMDRMGAVGVGGQFDRPAEMERGGFGGNGFGGAGGPGANARKGCQIFVRNLPFDFTWKMLKDNFNTCGIVQYADIKMENGKSKGCGVVRFDNPETAERACRTMNGYRLNGREIDVRIDRNA
uniref:Heterogeneous nuclear ribonucleoprotein M n=1 Tax=Oncorhynchus kisutch TaxID=8019 RepID=A0A8C7CK02_ONCKI